VPLAIQEIIANTIVAILAIIMELQMLLEMEIAPVMRVGKLPRAQPRGTRNVHRLCVKTPPDLKIIT
jgi:hypothetical protein